MTVNRRNFLGATLGLGLGAPVALTLPDAAAATSDQGPMPREYEEILARTRHLSHLGHPRSWWTVQQGFLPIAPERVMILDPVESPDHDSPGDRWSWRHRDERKRLQSRLTDWNLKWKSNDTISEEKQGLVVRIMYELARYYDALDGWEEWAFGMLARESLGSTGIGRHVAVPDHYQRMRGVSTENAHIDWWMILFPKGCDWESLDGKPVYAMFTQILTKPLGDATVDRLSPLCLLSLGLRAVPDSDRNDAPFFVRLSQMDRVSAVRLMNRYIVSAVHKEKNDWGY